MIINIFYLNYFKFANKNLQNQQKLFELEVFDYFIIVSQQSIIVQNMHDIFKKNNTFIFLHFRSQINVYIFVYIICIVCLV